MSNLEKIKELREMTGAGVNAIIEALNATQGDIDKSVVYLRTKGLAKAEKRKANIASNGLLGYYFHTNRKLITVVEVFCETDFAANSKDMIDFANRLALNVAAMNPRFISLESIPVEDLQKEIEINSKDLEGKPKEIKEKILEGRMKKYYEENVFVFQRLFDDETKTVQDLINEMVSKIGEKIVISRFFVIRLGENFCSSSILV